MFLLDSFKQHTPTRHCSRAYLWAQLATMGVYTSYFMAYTLPLLDNKQLNLHFLFLLKYIIESASFVLFAHCFLRPVLKTQPQLAGQRWLLVILFLIVAAALQTAVSFFLSELELLKATDMSQVTLLSEKHNSPLQMTFSKGFMLMALITSFSIMYALWVAAYVTWQNWQHRKTLQQQMQQAQLQQLTNQLSPHFLFNAFNSIRALIFEDQHKAADTVTRLSELFRFHLQAHLQPSATLEQEWQLCEQYLAIEQVRLEQRLQFSCDIDASLWQQKLPTLSLLTLVENAIKHGIAPNSGNGQLHIAASTLPHGWQLQVSNSVQNGTEQAGTGTGLTNLRHRLQLMYAGKAKFSVTPQQNSYCVKLEFADV